MDWAASNPGVLDFSRPGGFRCLVNLGERPVALPSHQAVLLASDSLADHVLPPDTSVWLRAD
jgi:alpha-glucosidase